MFGILAVHLHTNASCKIYSRVEQDITLKVSKRQTSLSGSNKFPCARFARHIALMLIYPEKSRARIQRK